eukprot:CAMPEP_0113676426 /NCGR_PEP_ID=MMETSP0038_2-20120614/8637_1 /TAXON_ID=2898 /ORGANISM="Cryptomonas paramecium" /LENGTH=100 /DNA_ID=CAMNT_0000593455 /DNA_START=18 /DNA_END=320 /DNA_ORIENTATION=- /assembly_acc=CAM_ASM_000170
MPTPLPGSLADESKLAPAVTYQQGSDNRGPFKRRRLPQAVSFGDGAVSEPPGAKGLLPSDPLNGRWRQGGAGGVDSPASPSQRRPHKSPLLLVAAPGRLA